MKDFSQIINKAIRPQDDLYQHVNDNWLLENSIPEEEDSWSNFHELLETTYYQLHAIIEDLQSRDNIEHGSIEQKVRDFYISGSVDTQRVEDTGKQVLFELFNEIDSCKDKQELVELTGKLHMRNVDVFWGIYIDQDEVDSSQYLLRLRQAGLSLPSREYYDQRQKKMKAFKSKLEKHISRMFKIIEYSDHDDSAGRKVYDLENSLAKSSRTPSKLRDVEANYNKITFTYLQKITPEINWKGYFQSLGITPPESLSVDQQEFFQSINKIFARTEIPILRQYMKWHVLNGFSNYMGDRVAEANFEFFGTTLKGTQQMKPLWKRLINTIDSHIGEALGKLYVDQYFPPDAKQRMDNLVTDIKKAFAERIRALEWMESDTKEYALKKLDNTYVQVGHPDKMRQYEKLKITNDSYIHNFLNAAVYESERNLNKLGQPVDREEWEMMTPSTVNACFSPNLNKITFPAGILQPPFFDSEADDAVNYGGIGIVIGHELTHGFDDEGSLFDAEGNLRQWRSDKDKKAFDKRAQIVVEQANRYEVLDGRNINGELTLGENIADIGGGEISFQALKRALERNGRPGRIDGFEPEKRFFLNFARVWRSKRREEVALQRLLTDPHAPPKFRTNNTVRNMDAFYEAFEPGKEDRLYTEPQKKAYIW